MIMTTKLDTDIPMVRIHLPRSVIRPTVTTVPPASAVRLNLDPDPTRRGAVDGGWWPHSRDATAELPGLIAAVDQRLGRRTSRIGLSGTAWTNIPRRIPAHGRTVKVGWFDAIDPLIVSLTITGGARIVLLAIPPDTPVGTANNALTLSTVSRGHTRPADILTTAHEVTLADTQQRNGQASWENEGGKLEP